MGYRRAANRDSCLHGHPWPEHLGRDTRGWAYCRACQRRSYSPDPAAIERAVAGYPPDRLTPRERTAAIQKLTRLGLSAPLIAERVGCSQRTVHRARTRAAAAA
jgi:DNA-binding CsgD family transcriptional regulator